MQDRAGLDFFELEFLNVSLVRARLEDLRRFDSLYSLYLSMKVYSLDLLSIGRSGPLYKCLNQACSIPLEVLRSRVDRVAFDFRCLYAVFGEEISDGDKNVVPQRG